MAPSNSTTKRSSAGVYNVKEDGLEYQHFTDQEETVPKDGEEYLQRFE